MSCESELGTIIAGIISADTGSGGLSQSNGTALVRTQFRDDDPQGERTLSNWPALSWKINSISAMDSFGAGAYMCDVRFDLKTDMDRAFDDHDAVVQRVRTKFHRQAMTGGTVFGFGTMRIVRVTRLEPTNSVNKELHTVMDARVVARTVSGV